MPHTITALDSSGPLPGLRGAHPVALYLRFLNADRTPGMVAALGVMLPIVAGLAIIFTVMLAIAERII